MLTYFGLVGYGEACCARRWLCSHVLKVLRFLSSLMPGGREFHEGSVVCIEGNLDGFICLR